MKLRLDALVLFQLHLSPISASRVKTIERFFAEITGNGTRRGAWTAVSELVGAIMCCLEKHNPNPKRAIWIESAGQILEKASRAK